MRDKWETWLESERAEFTKGGKRERASYELIANWFYETWNTTVSKELILKGSKKTITLISMEQLIIYILVYV